MFYRTVRVRTRDAVRVVGGYAEIYVVFGRRFVEEYVSAVIPVATTLSENTFSVFLRISTVS
jgi:hypothetical protein